MRFLNLLNGFALSSDAAEKISQDIMFDISRFPGTLKHMGIGMLSIFLVIGVIILAVFILNKAMSAIESKKSEK